MIQIWPNMMLNLKRDLSHIAFKCENNKKSFHRWRMLGDFTRNIFKCIDKALVSNTETIKYLKYFGVKNIKSVGNLKFIQNKYKNLALTKNLSKFIIRKNSWCSSSTIERRAYIN